MEITEVALAELSLSQWAPAGYLTPTSPACSAAQGKLLGS